MVVVWHQCERSSHNNILYECIQSLWTAACQSVRSQPHTWCFWQGVIQSIRTNSLLLPSFPAELARSCSVAHVFDWGLPLVSGSEWRWAPWGATAQSELGTGTELPWAGKQLQAPPTPTFISPMSVHRHSFVSLSCFNTPTLPSQSWGTAYPFIYLCIRRRKWTPTQGRRVKVRWTVRAYGCKVVCVCVHSTVSIYNTI